ncbi:universal stress protein [uncultured Maribacter sp.]|uniref:universal stress protein n=1 Tax=uncultured Maribacter sp. TaxID=431308 RepID=UPI002621DE51|nr:universal stress protein [uncultured Maribacter sp.]
MKNILVPTDFSNNAYNAFFHATELVKNSECTFYLLNAYPEDKSLWSKGVVSQLTEQLEEDSIVGLKNTCHRIKLDYNNPEHKLKTISKKGDLVKSVCTVIDEENIDLVVMGNHGCSELKAIFLGSNTLRVVENVKNCPILIVPKEIEFSIPKEIAFVTDYRRPFNAEVLKPLLTLAQYNSSRICVMHVNNEGKLTKEQQANKNFLEAFLKPLKHSSHWMPNFSTKADVIKLFLEELGIDMLAMVQYSHTFFENVTHEPVIKKVAYNLDIPFLVIPDRK